MAFAQSLAMGKAGESQIARWLQSRGNHVLPVYEKEINEYKGPVLYRPDGSQLICPDLLSISGKSVAWIEAKHKSAFTLNRNLSKARGRDVWNTGIDLHHYREYQQVQKDLPQIPVWLMFLHQVGVAKDTPDGKVSPTGLFMASINHLVAHECHRHPNHGRHGMVYWEPHSFQQHIPLEDFLERSSIMEFDGGMARSESTHAAKISIAETVFA